MPDGHVPWPYYVMAVFFLAGAVWAFGWIIAHWKDEDGD